MKGKPDGKRDMTAVGQESDITVCQVLGVLEIVKHDLIACLPVDERRKGE